MSNIVQKVIAVVFFLFLWVEDILTILTNVVDRTLYHSCTGYVLRKGFPPVNITFSSDHRAIHVILLGVLAVLSLQRLTLQQSIVA